MWNDTLECDKPLSAKEILLVKDIQQQFYKTMKDPQTKEQMHEKLILYVDEDSLDGVNRLRVLRYFRKEEGLKVKFERSPLTREYIAIVYY